MKKYYGLFLSILFCYVFSFSVSASNTNFLYDFRNETLTDFTEYDDISALQDDILDSLYTNLYDSNSSIKSNTKIDFTNATKVYVYTPQELLALLNSDNIVDNISRTSNYCWKIPVANKSDGVDYAVAYTNSSGNWTYYTASTTEFGKNEVLYIIDPDNINDTLLKNKIEYIQQLYALTISEMSMDLLVIDTGAETFAIPYASRPDFLNLENGKAYSTTDMYEILNTYFSEQTSLSDWPSGGGASNIKADLDLSTYVVITFFFISIFSGVVILRKKRLTRQIKH